MTHRPAEVPHRLGAGPGRRCLEDIRALFPPECNPFFAGFGNRDTDEVAYAAVGVPPNKVFIINNRSAPAPRPRPCTVPLCPPLLPPPKLPPFPVHGLLVGRRTLTMQRRGASGASFAHIVRHVNLAA